VNIRPYRKQAATEDVTMQNLIAVIFEGKNRAEELMSYLAAAKFSCLMEIENSCTISMNELNRASLQCSLPESLPAPKEISYWKVLANCILPKQYAIPFLSKAHLFPDKLDIEQSFISQLHRNLKADSSMLLICMEGTLPRRIESILVRFNGLVLSTSFSNQNEVQINVSLQPQSTTFIAAASECGLSPLLRYIDSTAT
jgi:uncharacterized membrane protein